MNIFRRILGQKYLVNKATGEIHRLSKVTGACGVDRMAKHNKMYVTEKKFQRIITSSTMNGCVHCLKDKSTD